MEMVQAVGTIDDATDEMSAIADDIGERMHGYVKVMDQAVDMFIIFEVCMLVSLCGLIYAFQNDYLTLTIVLKTAASLFFVLAGLCGFLKSRESRRFTCMMLIALLCSMAGDVFLALEKIRGFCQCCWDMQQSYPL